MSQVGVCQPLVTNAESEPGGNAVVVQLDLHRKGSGFKSQNLLKHASTCGPMSWAAETGNGSRHEDPVRVLYLSQKR